MKSGKIKFNIIDFIIILALVGIAAVCVLRADFVKKFTEVDNQKVEYVFEARNLKASSAEYLAEGDVVYIKENGKEIGKIVGFSVEEASTIVETADGRLIEGKLPGRIDITVTVETNGRQTENGIFINGGLFIAAGKELEITTQKLTYPMVIEEVYIKN